jgi:predicted transcriptional regulator of viral defense system
LAQREQLNIEQLVNYAMHLDIAVARRLGWVLEQLGIASTKIANLAQPERSGYRKLDPSSVAKGRYEGKWQLQLNYEGKL